MSNGLNLNTAGAAPAAAVTNEATVGTRPVAEQGNKASLRNDPPALVAGQSASLNQEVVNEVDEDSPVNLVNDALRIQQASNSGVIGTEAGEGTMFSSHPIANFQVGRFKFEKGLLRLDADDAAAFEKLMATLPPVEQSKIQKLDVEAAVAIVKQRIAEAQPGATQQFDSSIGERAKQMVGTGKLGDESEAFTNQGQQDMNAPVHGADPTRHLTTDDAAKGQEADGQK